MLIHDDCLDYMSQMKSESVDMIYLDPPFFTQKKQTLTDRDGNKFSFDDTWHSIKDYILFISKRLVEIKRIVKDSGNVFLQCDTSATHYLRIEMDNIFGTNNFRSEIIWVYKRWSNSKKGLLNAHQTILHYSKTEKYKYNKLYTKYSPTTNLDQILQERARNSQGKTVYKTDDDGKIVFSCEKKGVPLSDVWEIPLLNPKAKERVGYPTQKPILLLERIIEISTDAGDLVLDPFCGSGTTLVAADLMGRENIGIDNNIDAIKLSEQRLNNPVKSKSNLLIQGKHTYDTKTYYEKAILNRLGCDIIQRNKGIDGVVRQKYDGGMVAVKIQKEYETLTEAINLLIRASLDKNFKYLFLIKTNAISDLFQPVLPKNLYIVNSAEVDIELHLNNILNRAI